MPAILGTVPTRTAPGLGVELAYDERGSGETVLLIHGTALTRLVWRETIEALGGDVRAIAYDRRGYGDSGAPQPYTGTTVEEQSEDAAALIRALDAAPALVCGHSLGGVVALDLLLRHASLVRAAVVVEPPLMALSAGGAEALGALREEVEKAALAAGPEAGVEAFIEAVHGAGALVAMGTERATAVRASARAAFADLAAAAGWELHRRELAAIDRPVAVVRGSRSDPVRREVAGTLAELIGAAKLHELNAGPVAPLDAPAELAAVIASLAG